ncbi:carbonic anhydrase [Plakobranchus ocellatus]|uniref:Carbonic anhydrase n=1 Tax=Plakobranchus ocellatus TaxID=259542 RepID=A0AAV4BCN7_9GAST|nr:carbonic anhydrase [Plakobranchus ocellatus]
MDKIIRGVLKFNSRMRKDYTADIDRFSQKVVKPLTVFITCMDSRLNPITFVQANPGEVFCIRNPGNMVPHYCEAEAEGISAEGAGLELGCIMNDIGNVVVCGHSDCKAVNSLYAQRNCWHRIQERTMDSPLKSWLSLHGLQTVQKFTKLFSEEDQQRSARGETILGGFKFNFGREEFVCNVDPNNKFNLEDKLSQFHCLQQASNVASYPLLQPYLKKGEVKIHAMWFDVSKGQMHLFSPTNGYFIPIEETSADELAKEITS